MFASKGLIRPRVNQAIDSFTLVEMLVVMGIIAILAALSLAAGFAVFNQGARSRAKAEITAMSSALENYKADNGVYAQITNVAPTNSYPNVDGSVAGDVYQQSSQLLYQALSGQTNYLDVPVPGMKAYMTFKVNQLGNNSAAAGTTGAGATYIRDPWNDSYAYTVGDGTTNNPPYNGYGFFDLWTTAGSKHTAPNTNAWICNWSF